ncbi:uncharacterized protein EV154DRAFT_503110 [Mucor mucedo]|uniref:uncharacterized protein n=1 Tax=Mucor mucedo TaxID=29922 RepID=UPI00221FF18F|nr:uncharacterized protein EV154DRAFT_510024 [Mucor mucedo]XP_051459474.1 uncharacterized protein EV154DRAFT_503110 [Mucor mucedo]KAI7890933.1 hypothetical protein EV154DRAFT_510024 [Mucor mucedo]KAI7893058.1 hypothetical protein EV154DRAFT_503110 [Mucor mucedo]
MANLIVLNAQASSVLQPHLAPISKKSITATAKPFQTKQSDEASKIITTIILQPYH